MGSDGAVKSTKQPQVFSLTHSACSKGVGTKKGPAPGFEAGLSIVLGVGKFSNTVSVI